MASHVKFITQWVSSILKWVTLILCNKLTVCYRIQKQCSNIFLWVCHSFSKSFTFKMYTGECFRQLSLDKNQGPPLPSGPDNWTFHKCWALNRSLCRVCTANVGTFVYAVLIKMLEFIIQIKKFISCFKKSKLQFCTKSKVTLSNHIFSRHHPYLESLTVYQLFQLTVV